MFFGKMKLEKERQILEYFDFDDIYRSGRSKNIHDLLHQEPSYLLYYMFENIRIHMTTYDTVAIVSKSNDDY